MAKRHVIWSNLNLNREDWSDFLEEEHPDVTDEYEQDRLIEELNGQYLSDERMNLDIQLGQPIIVIADLGLWNGRRDGYKIIESGNIKDCLYDSSCDYLEWYVDGRGDFRCEAHHHDGVNHYLYRVFKYGVSDTQIENLKSKIIAGEVTGNDISRFTRRLGDEIGKVYGWSFGNKAKTEHDER